MAKYLQSYGDGFYDYDDDEKRRKHCSCRDFLECGVCNHMYWFRGQETVNVDERYL